MVGYRGHFNAREEKKTMSQNDRFALDFLSTGIN